MHFLWWVQLIDGRSSEALRTAKQAAQYAFDNFCGPSKAVEAPRLRHLPWLTQLRFGKWDEILAVPQPPNTNDFLVDRALWHFTRGAAFAAKKDVAAAEREQAALEAIATSEEARKLSSPQFPVTDTLQVAKHWLAGRVAGAKGQRMERIAHFEKAVEADEALPYMEPSYWPLPARPSLGAAYLEAGDAAKAEETFRTDLRRWPRNGWSLFGLEQALRAQGKNESADLVRREFEKAWKRADVKLSLDWL
jgi:tetratricopeptide (TPR) repeat protein